MKPVVNDPIPPLDLQALSALAPELARTFVSVAADIALVIDAQGVIQHVAMGAEPNLGGAGRWLGQPWVDTVTGSTRRKIELLLSEVQTSGVTRRREVNHPSQDATDIPVAYSAIRLGRDGPVLAVGRDLRAVAAIQQRFVQATQAMERDYWSQRQAESHVRTLYQVATDAVLVVDARTLQVVHANHAAHALLSPLLRDGLLGTDVAHSVLQAERPGFNELLATARATGRPGVMRAHAASAALGRAPQALVPVEVSATPLRSGPDMQLVVQLRSIEADGETADAMQRRSAWVDTLPDALVVTDSSGRVLMCNPAFTALCRVADGASAHRRTLAELLGDPAHTIAHALLQARRHGLAQVAQAFVGHPAALASSFTSSPGSAGGAGSASQAALQPTVTVELAAMLLTEGDQECVGLRLRKLQPAVALPTTATLDPLRQGISHLADQVGLQALPQLLQEAAALAERHLISTALARCQGRLSEVGSLLGIPLTVLQQRMQHLGLAEAGQDALHSPSGQPLQSGLVS